MSELISKLTSYNLFNYLFPGVVFIAFLNNSTNYIITDDNIFILAFLSYFIGLVISRIGSVIIEPLFRKIKIINFKEYKDFIEASKVDEKLEVLSEQNNVFRTIISMFLIIILVKVYSNISIYYNLCNFDFYIIYVILLIIFILAYRKQTNYITSRIEKVLSKK
ncbi:MAG: hypothetical protein PHR68_01970 [Candidatus Gracilibacteria bacterium]|nr:hypothetical protein [Candidatus Gracilibacteria bacterium]